MSLGGHGSIYNNSTNNEISLEIREKKRIKMSFLIAILHVGIIIIIKKGVNRSHQK